MKTSVTKIMMSFALMGCLIIGASDASAQSRSRSQGGSSSSRSQSAAVSRSSSRPSSPTVSRSSGISRSSSTTSRATTAPQVSRSSSTTSRATTAPQVSRDTRSGRSNGATSRGGNSGMTRRSDSAPNVTPQGHTTRDHSTTTGTMTRRGDNERIGNRPGGNMDNKGNDRHDSKGGNRPGGNMGNKGNDRHDSKGGNRPGGNMGNKGNDRHDNKGGNRPGGNNFNPGGDHGKHDNHGGNHGYNHNHRYDYGSHHYRDQFRWNHSHHNWSRPLPPPSRAHRPAPFIWHRPVIPAGWRPYAGAPVIDRILGLMFGSLYEASLDHLYYNGYYIDGYADNIIYLRDVPMLNLYWPDVMLNYEYGRLANAQFIYHSSYYDRARFDRVYNSLCRIYGPPVINDGMTISWYGGNRTGWVTLTMTDSYGDYYTTMSIGY